MIKIHLTLALLSCIPLVAGYAQGIDYEFVVQTGTQIPGASNGELLTVQEIDHVAQNETGTVAIAGRATSSISGTVNVVFTLKNGVFETVLQSGQPVTLFDVGVTWGTHDRFVSLAINDTDDLAVVGPTFDGIDEGYTAIKRSGAINTEILKTGEEAPGIPGSSISSLQSIQINAVGDVIVQLDALDGGTDIDGFWLHRDNSTTPFVHKGQLIALDLRWFPIPLICLPETGDPLFTAYIAEAEGGETIGSGLYSKPIDGEENDFGQIRLQAKVAVPGSGGNELIDYPTYTAVNEDQRIAFASSISQGGGGGAIVGEGLFLGDLPASGAIGNLSNVFANSVNYPPDGSDVVGISFVNLNNSGEIAFRSVLDDFSEPASIVLRHVNGVVEVIATEDLPLEVEGSSLTPRFLLLQLNALNDDGELLFVIRDYDNNEYLVKASASAPIIPIDPGNPIVPEVPIDPANPIALPTAPEVTVNGRAVRQVSTPRVTLRGRIAIGTSPIRHVRIKPHGKPFRNVQLNRKRTKWTAKVPLKPGKNIIRIKATDLFGRESIVARVRVNRR